MNNPILISTAAYDGYDLSVSLKEISELEIKRVELAFIEGYTDPFTEAYFSSTNAKVISSLLSKHGLTCLSFASHIDLSQDTAVDRFKGRMGFSKEIGATYIISNAGPEHRQNQFMKNIEQLAQWAESFDIMIVLENPGDGKKNVIDHGQTAPQIIKQIGSERVRLNYDFGNLISHCFEKLRPEDDYKPALPYTAHFHIKDVTSDASGWHFTEIGRGDIDYETILKELALEPNPHPLCLEIPLRVSRARDASPRRATSPVALPRIRRVMSGSLRFVQKVLSSATVEMDRINMEKNA
jgi:sugar phosphate isomerase/epimerase